MWLKKYFYILRPVLACRWIERDLGVVPIEFQKLVDTTLDEGALREAILELLSRKMGGEELDRGPKIPVISDFLASEIARLNADIKHEPLDTDPELLDRTFHSLLKTINGTDL